MTGTLAALRSSSLRCLSALVGLLSLTGAATADGLANPRDSIAIFQQATETGDLESIMALYAPNAVLLFPGAPVIGGTDKIRANYARSFAAGQNHLTIHAAQMDGEGDTAVILWVWSFSITPPGGETKTRTGRSMVFFKRGDGGWLIYADMLQDAPL